MFFFLRFLPSQQENRKIFDREKEKEREDVRGKGKEKEKEKFRIVPLPPLRTPPLPLSTAPLPRRNTTLGGAGNTQKMGPNAPKPAYDPDLPPSSHNVTSSSQASGARLRTLTQSSTTSPKTAPPPIPFFKKPDNSVGNYPLGSNRVVFFKSEILRESPQTNIPSCAAEATKTTDSSPKSSHVAEMKKVFEK